MTRAHPLLCYIGLPSSPCQDGSRVRINRSLWVFCLASQTQSYDRRQHHIFRVGPLPISSSESSQRSALPIWTYTRRPRRTPLREDPHPYGIIPVGVESQSHSIQVWSVPDVTPHLLLTVHKHGAGPHSSAVILKRLRLGTHRH